MPSNKSLTTGQIRWVCIRQADWEPHPAFFSHMKQYKRRRGKVGAVICPNCKATLYVQDSVDARRRSRKRAEGICTTCGTRKAKPGYFSCEFCLQRGRKQSKARWQQELKRRRDEIRIARCNT